MRTSNIIKYILLPVIIFLSSSFQENGRTQMESKVDMFHFSGRHLVCAIGLGDDIRGGHGLETGFTYEILQAFAEDHNCQITVMAGDRNADYMESLRKGSIDLLVIHHDDATEDIIISETMNSCSTWAVKAGKDGEIREINEWLEIYIQTDRYQALKDRFFRAYNPLKRAEKGTRSNIVSPYDDMIKKHAESLGWDWRMLAAVVYQESKFSISSSSHRGAMGLMQVMPQTAQYYNVDNLTDPEQNLIAGTSHLMRLQKLYSSCGMDHDELIKFTLAAYNAGEGRIKDCRKLAESRNLDNRKWDNIVKVIPAMRDDSILEDENVALGKFKGTETIAYVESIMNIYQAICSICPEN